MTIATTTNRISYTGNGATVAFTVPYTFFASSDLLVYLDGVLKTITTHYTVSGSTVTFLSAPANGVVVLIVRSIPFTQTTDYADNEPLRANEIETNLDRLTVLAQQNNEAAARGINLAVTDTASSLTLPVTRANKVFAFDASGDPVMSTRTLAQIEAGSTDAATSAAAAAVSAAAALVSENNAATTYDNFDDRYLGQKAADPTLDNDGNALITGALYFNNVSNLMKVWNGSAWLSFAPPFSLTTQVTGRLPYTNIAQSSANSIKGNNTGSTADSADLTIPEARNVLQVGKRAVDLASASTTNLGDIDGDYVHITGTTTITSFGTTGAVEGMLKHIKFDSALTITVGANILLPGSASITTTGGDRMGIVYQGSSVWRVMYYTRANGTALVESVAAQPFFAGQSTTATGAAPSDYIAGSATTNRGSHYNTTTGIFTAPTAGDYAVLFVGLAQTTAPNAAIQLNGSTVMSTTAGSTSGPFTLAAIIDCATNDQIKIRLLSGTISASQDYLSIRLLA
jgi:hypothetical protein